MTGQLMPLRNEDGAGRPQRGDKSACSASLLLTPSERCEPGGGRSARCGHFTLAEVWTNVIPCRHIVGSSMVLGCPLLLRSNKNP